MGMRVNSPERKSRIIQTVLLILVTFAICFPGVRSAGKSFIISFFQLRTILLFSLWRGVSLFLIRIPDVMSLVTTTSAHRPNLHI